ncbi:zf-C3HC domain-containing protein [Cephalotus follicularis]|uniref:Zf-C3HC domain-containing protein n=1 Tax=Cephalotus follicularis TaxID=3775 RepID=A0A1Q3C4K6_CEPFO|nr:zf-C3HC domain-containing protein [Cephalotus follicularis]
MREEVISSGGTMDPTPAGSSAGASSPAVPTNIGSLDWSSHGHNSKAASLSCVGSQPPCASLSTSAGGSGFGSSRSSCRPWERGDLLRRLATFKPSNWIGKPKVVSSLACAQRGWMNTDVDKIVCESCGACLSFVSLSTLIPAEDEVEDAGEAFAKQLDVGHKVACPWRGCSCPESLVQFPPTPQSALIGGYKDRCDGLLQFQFLPIVAAAAIEQMRLSRGLQIERLLFQSQNHIGGEADFKSDSVAELETSRDGSFFSYSRAQKLISLCGWEPRWLPDVQDCEEHSAQSARNGCSGPTQTRAILSHDPGPSKNALSASAKKGTGKGKVIAVESRFEHRSPLLDCSLCGATVRISDFLTVPRPTRFAPNNIDIPDTSKKMGLTRGVSAASGINGWVAADDPEKEQTEDRDEVATTDERKLLQADVDLNLTMGGALSVTQVGRTAMSANINDADMGRDLMIGQPAGSEVGDRAASYDSWGPSSRKRSLEIGGSSDNRPNLRMQQADSVEGTVIDRDGDEVTDGRQYSAAPSKRARDSDIFDTYCSPYPRDSSVAGPSHSVGLEFFADGNRATFFGQGSNQIMGISSARDSARASSVIAMDTHCHNTGDDSMESVENYPGDVDDIHFPSSSTYGNLDMNEASELNYSNHAQQSIYFRPAAEAVPGEMGVSSTNDGEEIFNAETVTAQARDGFSFGISGGSVGMCASHEAEMYGADVSIHRTDSVVGDVEPRIEDAENQGQTGESALVPGLVDEIIRDEINREDPHGDSQEMLSRSVGRDDSGSKVDGSVKAESVESGEKISQSCKLALGDGAHPSLSCNANVFSGYDTTNKEVAKTGKSSSTNNCPYPESDYATANGIGPPKGESNYEEAIEFDPIIHHNQFCPWVNGNVAAAGCSSSGSSISADTVALCGWQLTLDALDALRSLGNIAVQIVQSESAASLHKDDHQTNGQKLLRRHSMSKSHGQH